jgi:glycosyltransferase involved in cell wall biosynthesis
LKAGEKNKAFFFSRFRLTEERAGGGVRRERQLAEALAPLNFRFISALEGGSSKFPPWRKLKSRKPAPIFWRKDIQGYIERLQTFSRRWAHRIGPDIPLVIMENPLFFPALAEKTSKLGIPLVVTCQNIESMSAAQINPRLQDRMLRVETELLSLADLVVTISREEAFFLNNLNMKTFYYSYYPVEEIADRLLQIRERRKKTKKSGLLLLGTINNRPTLDGFVDVINFWSRPARSGIDEPLIVAGWGTEQLRHLGRREIVEFRGPLEDTALDDILAQIKACLCYQKSGAGALTKIVEMLVAGIPVLANFQSARSYYGTAGLIEFSGLEDLAGAFPLAENWEGDIPVPPRPDAGPLLAEIRKAAA